MEQEATRQPNLSTTVVGWLEVLLAVKWRPRQASDHPIPSALSSLRSPSSTFNSSARSFRAAVSISPGTVSLADGTDVSRWKAGAPDSVAGGVAVTAALLCPPKRAVDATFSLRVPLPSRFGGKYDLARRPASTSTLLKPRDRRRLTEPRKSKPTPESTPSDEPNVKRRLYRSVDPMTDRSCASETGV